jgi:hypothetical protein
VTSPRPSGVCQQLPGLLDIGRALRSGGDLGHVLSAVAAGFSRASGFGTVVVNLRRPAWDDFEVVLAYGCDEAAAALLGKTTSWSDWEPILADEFEHGSAYFIPAGTRDWHGDMVSFISDIAASGDPRAWDAEDALMVPLIASTGELLGIVSVDEPLDGRRPDAAQLEQIALACNHAAAAVEHAQATAAARRHSAAVEHLLTCSL